MEAHPWAFRLPRKKRSEKRSEIIRETTVGAEGQWRLRICIRPSETQSAGLLLLCIGQGIASLAFSSNGDEDECTHDTQLPTASWKARPPSLVRKAVTPHGDPSTVRPN